MARRLSGALDIILAGWLPYRYGRLEFVDPLALLLSAAVIFLLPAMRKTVSGDLVFCAAISATALQPLQAPALRQRLTIGWIDLER